MRERTDPAGPRGRSLRTKGLAVLLVPALALLAAAAALLVVERRGRQTRELVTHTSDVRAQQQRILGLVVDAETGVRGYIATGAREFLETYERTRHDLPAAFAELGRLRRHPDDDPAALRELTRRALDELGTLSRLGAERGAGDPAVVAATRNSKATTDEIRRLVAGTAADQEAFQRREQAAAGRLDDLARWITLCLVVVGLVGGAGANGVFFSRVVGRIRRAEESARRLAAAESVAAGTYGGDEIDQLNGSLHAAATLVATERARLELALDLGKIVVFELDDQSRLRGPRGDVIEGAPTLEAGLTAVEPADRQRILALIADVRRDGAPRDFTAELVGGLGSLAGRLTRIEMGDGEYALFGVATDVTQLKLAEQALRESERQRAIDALGLSERRGRHNALLLASVGEGIYSIGADGLCTSINPAAARMLGFEVAELIGADLHRVVHHARPDGTPYPDAECPVRTSIRTGVSVRVQGEVFWRKDGSRLPVEYSSFPLADGDAVRGAVVTFVDVTDREQERLEQEQVAAELRDAIRGGEMVLHYQPKVDLTTGACEAVEALVRWQRADRLVFPDEFVPLAERSGAIHDLTDWVIAESLRQVAEWRGSGVALRVAVNLSTASLRNDRISEYVAAAAARAGLAASCLEVEITETTLAEDTDTVLENLAHFRAMGVRCAIDDFGTGFSSLSYLKQLPVHYIKIDKSFVMNMPRDPRDQAIVAAAVHMAHSLGMRVVAEGVEDDLVLRMLRRSDCDIGQGYHWSRPVPAADLRRWLASRT